MAGSPARPPTNDSSRSEEETSAAQRRRALARPQHTAQAAGGIEGWETQAAGRKAGSRQGSAFMRAFSLCLLGVVFCGLGAAWSQETPIRAAITTATSTVLRRAEIAHMPKAFEPGRLMLTTMTRRSTGNIANSAAATEAKRTNSAERDQPGLQPRLDRQLWATPRRYPTR